MVRLQAADAADVTILGTASAAVGSSAAISPRLAGPGDLEAKATANQASDAAAAALHPDAAADAALAKRVPSLVKNFAGQFDDGATLADVGLAAGTTRVIQLVNRKFAIYSRSTSSTTPVSQGTLGSFVGLTGRGDIRHPQIIWDPTTTRFYYVVRASQKNNTSIMLAFGWSKTSSPNSAADFCKYVLFESPNEIFDFPTLGDSQTLMIFGNNVYNFNNIFSRAQVTLVKKPAAGTTCPKASTLSISRQRRLVDSSNNRVFAPVPANNIERLDPQVPRGFIVARNGALPSNSLWIYDVVVDPEFGPLVGGGRRLTLPFSYTIPADATQPGFTQKIDTGLAFPTQAVLARNPRRSNFRSLWTQHTVRNGNFSSVRYYEIDPFPATPVLLRTGNVSTPNTFLFNASISPDRRVDGNTAAFGDSFVLQYNRSGAASNIRPGIRLASSLSGAALTFATLVNATSSFRNSSCASAGSVCRWGNYSAVSPDPRPTITGRGVVWLSNQFSGVGNPTTTRGNWRTRIAAIKP